MDNKVLEKMNRARTFDVRRSLYKHETIIPNSLLGPAKPGRLPSIVRSSSQDYLAHTDTKLKQVTTFKELSLPDLKLSHEVRKSFKTRGLSMDTWMSPLNSPSSASRALARNGRPPTKQFRSPNISRQPTSRLSGSGHLERLKTADSTDFPSSRPGTDLLVSREIYAYIIRPGFDAKERFKHASRLVLILLKWISSLSEKGDSEDSGGRTFTDIANEACSSDTLGNSGLSFDVSEFRARKEVNISNEAKAILSTPSYLRTAEQLQTALFGLQHLKSFAEYPLHMQEKLCKVAWFQQVPPKRVIIRQGHYAENFYFILSGQAVVRILDKHPKTGEPQLRTATIMRKGTSFGELALLHHSMRTATVVSQDTVQLLAIGRDDFFQIFMSGNSSDGIPEHIKFVSSLDFMRNWPVEKLLERPEVCLFHFFKRGVVIVKDSTKSEWLYIIKSGSCQVMTQLKSVTSKLEMKANVAATKPSFSFPRRGTGDIGSRIKNGRKTISEIDLRIASPIVRARQEYLRTFIPNISLADKNNARSETVVVAPVVVRESTGFSKSRFQNMPCIKKAHFTPHQNSSNRSGISNRLVNSEEVTNTLPIEGMPLFVQVEVLKPKDVFGLSSVQFGHEVEIQQTSVSLVSNGAECIMLSKRFFTDHANEKVKKLVRQQVRPYPTHDTLQENLQKQVDWNVYKKKLIRHTLNQIKTEKSLTT